MRLIGVLMATLAWISPAAALEPVVERAYQAGKQALDEDRPEDALFHFKKALARADGASVTTWQMLLAVGVTYRDLDKSIFAREYFQRFLAVTEKHRDILTQKWRDRRETVSQTLAQAEVELSKNHAFVLVTSTPPGASITVAGAVAGADEDAVTPFSLIVPAGAHEVSLTLAGHQTYTHTLSVKAGGITTLEATLVAGVSDAAIGGSTHKSEQTAADSSLTLTEHSSALSATSASSEGATWAPWVVIGSAGALAAIGGAMTALGMGAQETLDTLSATPLDQGSDAKAAEWSQATADLDTYNALSMTFYVLAGSAAVGGLVWLLVDNGGAKGDPTATPVSMGLSPIQGGLYGHAAWSF
jgi:hypothetical protein